MMAYERAREKEAFENFLDMGDDIEVEGEVRNKVDRDLGEWVEIPGDTGDGVGWRLPTLEEVQKELLDRRRRKLLDKLG